MYNIWDITDISQSTKTLKWDETINCTDPPSSLIYQALFEYCTSTATSEEFLTFISSYSCFCLALFSLLLKTKQTETDAGLSSNLKVPFCA